LPGRHDGQADAFRHCWLNCQATRECGCVCAEGIDAREWITSRGWIEAGDAMDLLNNHVGRYLGEQQGSCEDLCLRALKSKDLVWFEVDPNRLPGMPRRHRRNHRPIR
jgi:hypothetical protein